MSSKRKTGPAHAARKRRRWRRNKQWAYRHMVKKLCALALEHLSKDARYPQLLYRAEATVAAGLAQPDSGRA